MVRSLQGGKIKNIKNLLIDTLEDVSPEAVCIHVSTNDISSGRSVEAITADMENLISLIHNQGKTAILSLFITRNDKHAEKVKVVNDKLIELCNRYRAGYIEHKDIQSPHLNSGGLHLARQFNYLLNDSLVNCFSYLVENDFCMN